MTFLPIVGRELRVAARRPSTYWTRAFAGLVAILFFGGALFFQSGVAPKQLGQSIFNVVSGIFLFTSLAAGIRYTSDCLSEEKREGTLGLLFLTDLRGYDVVLGKLAATSLSCLYGLLAIFPVLAIPLLMGGVAVAEFWRMVLVLLNALFLSLSVGMLVSAISRNARKAMSATLLLLVALSGGLPALGAWQAHRHGLNAVEESFLFPCAGYAYAQAFDQQYTAHPGQYLMSMLIIQGIAWTFLALASVIARNSWQDKPPGAVRMRFRDRWQQWCYGTRKARSAFRRRLLGINPCFWLGARQRLKPAMVWAWLGLVSCLWLWGALKWRGDWLQEGTYLCTTFALHTALKLWIASESCLRLGPDHRSGALELLLSTPLRIREILRGQMLALRRQFLWPMAVVAAVDFVLMLHGTLRLGEAEDTGWIALYLALIFTLPADAYALSWTGMWIGLTAKRPNRATSGTIARVLLLPWGIFAATTILMAFAQMWRRWADRVELYIGLWLAIGIAIDGFFALRSHSRLLNTLRVVATRRFAAAGTWLRPKDRRRDSPQRSSAMNPAMTGR
jgi:ABC-2 type transporter